ncbi:MAG: hypothetical protein ACK4EY_08820 [Flavipsychrobacter sp.]
MKYLLSLLCLLASHSIYAQDTLYYVKDAPILIKLEEVNPGKIKYKTWDYQQGPSYIAARRDIAKVVLDGGKILWLNERAWEKDIEADRAASPIRRSSRKAYGRNIVSVSPIAVVVNGFGGGIAYEHINKSGTLGIHLPVYGTLDYKGAYFIPSLRIYPLGQRIASFFVAPTLIAGYGERFIYKDSVDKYGYEKSYNSREETMFLGFLAEVGVNFQLTQKLFVSLAGGGGVNYADLAYADKSKYAALGKFSLAFGYRF